MSSEEPTEAPDAIDAEIVDDGQNESERFVELIESVPQLTLEQKLASVKGGNFAVLAAGFFGALKQLLDGDTSQEAQNQGQSFEIAKIKAEAIDRELKKDELSFAERIQLLDMLSELYAQVNDSTKESRKFFTERRVQVLALMAGIISAVGGIAVFAVKKGAK